jgi:S-formylglutathione hydrolase FrmB
MKKLLSTIALFSIVISVFAQWPAMGKVEYKTMPSKILAQDREYAIYLPRSYTSSQEKSYPVLYLLHGGGGSHTDWEKQGHLTAAANQIIAGNEACEMIIVCPEAGKTFMNYFNNPEWRYEDYFFQELIPFIEANYRVKPDKKNRAIAGLSMGGGGTIVYASHHPELFCAAYAMSGYLYRQNLPWTNQEDPVREKMQKLVEDNNCVKFAGNASPEKIEAMKTVDWFIDCGDDDFTLKANLEFVMTLNEKTIPNQLRVRDGSHNWEYWNSALYIALPFVSNCFRK